jgi:hypothetical protein
MPVGLGQFNSSAVPQVNFSGTKEQRFRTPLSSFYG